MLSVSAILASTSVVVLATCISRDAYNNYKLARMRGVQQSLEVLLSGLKDAEVGQRGYVLSGSRVYGDFLEPYFDGVSTTNAKLRELEKILEPSAFNQINKLSTEKLKELSQTIDYVLTENPQKAKEIVLSRRGKLLMDEIRSLVNQQLNKIKQDKTRLNENLALVRRVTQVSLFFLISIIVFQGRIVFLVFKDYSKRIKSESRRLKIENELLQIEQDRYESLSDFLQKALENFAHDIRSPLSGVSLEIQLIQLNYEEGNKYYGRLDKEKILQKCNRIIRLLNRIFTLCESVLTLAKEPVFERINIKTLVQEIGEEFTDNKHQVIFEATEGDEYVISDEQYVTAILYNLLSNASKFTPRGKQVSLLIDLSEEKYIYIRVKDEGIGIPPQDLSKIFDRFTRATNTGNLPGTGLGLSIVLDRLKALKGEMLVNSKVDIGTTFVLTLPRKIN